MWQGMNAFVNGELGTVKYVGRVDFADGIWIGVHLKNPSMFRKCFSGCIILLYNSILFYMAACEK